MSSPKLDPVSIDVPSTGVRRVARPSLKGTAFRSTLAAIEKVYGAAALRAVKAALDAPSRAALEHVLPVSWYPVSLSAALHDAVRREIGFGDWEASRAIGREAARMDYTGVYRVVLRSVQYDTVFERIELAWRGYYSQGTFAWTRPGPGSMRATVSDVRGFNTGMWIACAGRTETLLLLTGARSADVAVSDATEHRCTFEAMWLE
jgi:hypothetical protein